MLTEKKEIDKIEIINLKNIQVREANIIERDGVEISRTFHRYVLSPGDDISTQPDKIKQLAEVLWADMSTNVSSSEVNI